MGFKSRCPLALLCRGHQHIPVLLRRRSSLPLRQPRLANRRSAAGSPERPLAVSAPSLPRAALRGPWAAPTPPPILHGCGRLGAPCAPQSCGGQHGIMRPWCAETACAGGCCWPCREGGVAGPTPCGFLWHPGAARGKILTKRWPCCPG